MSIYFFLYVWLVFCQYGSNKRKVPCIDRSNIFCVNSHVPKEGLWLVEIEKLSLYKDVDLKSLELINRKICEILSITIINRSQVSIFRIVCLFVVSLLGFFVSNKRQNFQLFTIPRNYYSFIFMRFAIFILQILKCCL